MKKTILFTLLASIQFYGFSQSQITLDASKDLQVWSADPTAKVDRGVDRQDIVIYEWTKDGTPSTKYGLLDFDFSRLPEGSEITEATLLLFHDPSSTDQGHSQLSGSNEAVLQRITSSWDETTSWNEKPTSTEVNQATLPASESETQNYTIDVTTLAQDILEFNSFGFIIKLANTSHYRSLVFASNEHPNTNLRPKLKITYTVPSSNCIVLSSAEGKDIQVWSADPTAKVDRGVDRQDIVIYEWTKDGTPSTKYGLLDFDFNQIPENATVTEATLSLFHDLSSTDLGHSQLSGSNKAILQRITSSWDETTSWNETPNTVATNQIEIPASESGTQDYVIDIKTLTQDIINDKSNSFGFLIKMAETTHYRSLVFASGEHPNQELHPTLEVCYTKDVVNSISNPFLNNEHAQMSVFPNPVKDVIQINSETETNQFQLINNVGITVLEGTISDNTLDVSSITSGIYLLKIGSKTTRIIKE